MKHKAKRPVFLNLLLIRLPLTGIVSISHRLTGLLLVLSLPLLIDWFDRSLRDAAGFEQVRQLMTGLPARLYLLLLLWFLLHHLLAGLRILLIDLDFGVQRHTARASAAWVVFGGLLLTALLGGLWL